MLNTMVGEVSLSCVNRGCGCKDSACWDFNVTHCKYCTGPLKLEIFWGNYDNEKLGIDFGESRYSSIEVVKS